MNELLARRLAHATLIGLRATLPLEYEAYHGHGKGYMLLPERAPLDRNEVAAALAALPKPVLCVALALDGILAIAAWPNKSWWGESTPAALTVGREAVTEFADARMLLKVEGEEPLVLTPEELFQWREQYQIVGLNMSWSFARNDPLALSHSATDVVRFSRVHPRPGRIMAALTAYAASS